MTGDDEPAKKVPTKKAVTKGKGGKSGGMISFDEATDEDDVF